MALFSLFFSLITPIISRAEEENPNPWDSKYIDQLTKDTPVREEGDLLGIIFEVIRYILGFLGVVAIGVIIYGGAIWMTAGGNDEKVSKAKKTIIAAAIGLAIILLAYAITYFVILKINEFSAVVPQEQ